MTDLRKTNINQIPKTNPKIKKYVEAVQAVQAIEVLEIVFANCACLARNMIL